MKTIRQETVQFEPPDGGWGWMIVVANALGNVVVIPVLQNFGLIFNGRFKSMGLSATDVTVIININASFGMLMGLVNGMLLKKYGYRKTSVLGGLFLTVGVIFTSYSNSFTMFIINYGLMASLGFGMGLSAFSLAVNTYFRKRRGLAVGLTMTGTGLGPVIMPLLISFLMDVYGDRGTMLIIGGLAMNCFVASSLLQPVKWHMKAVVPQDVEGELMEEEPERDTLKVHKSSIHGSKFSINFDGETVSLYGVDSPKPRKKYSTCSTIDRDKLNRMSYKRSVSTQDYVERGDENVEWVSEMTIQSSNSKHPKIVEPEPSQNCFKSFLGFLDIDLLKDPTYVNLMIGMSLAICAEMNFSLLTPFILSDFGYSTYESAQVLSCVAFADIIFRFIAPFISHYLKQPPKVMYLLSLVMLIASRTALIFISNYTELITVALALGVAKGFRTVFMPLLIPAYVPLEKLANASGMQMVANGIIILIGGPFLGLIRDLTGSYDNCIIVINIITFSTIVLWTSEDIFKKYFKRKT